MGEIRGNPGILGQGGYLVHSILGQDGRDTWESQDTWTRGVCVHPILGCSRDGGDTWKSRDTWTRGVSSSPHPRMLPGWERYLGIPGYLDKGGI